MIFTASVNRTNSEILKPHLFSIQNLLHYYRSEPVCLPPHAQIIQHLQLNKSKMIFLFTKTIGKSCEEMFSLCFVINVHIIHFIFQFPLKKLTNGKLKDANEAYYSWVTFGITWVVLYLQYIHESCKVSYGLMQCTGKSSEWFSWNLQ